MNRWQYALPFVVAVVAATAAYFFARRAKRSEVVVAERQAAFRALQERLLAFARYCNAFAAEIDGGDFEPRLEDLAPTNHGSVLDHRNDIQSAVQQYSHLLPKGARLKLSDLDGQLGLLCTFVLGSTTEELHSSRTADGYRRMAERVQDCINDLYSELKLPR